MALLRQKSRHLFAARNIPFNFTGCPGFEQLIVDGIGLALGGDFRGRSGPDLRAFQMTDVSTLVHQAQYAVPVAAITVKAGG